MWLFERGFVVAIAYGIVQAPALSMLDMGML